MKTKTMQASDWSYVFLAIDVGNTHTTFGAFTSSGELFYTWRLQTNPKNTADELTLSLLGLLKMQHLAPTDISQLGLSCVVPSLLRSWKVAAHKLDIPLFVLHETKPLPLEIKAPHPESAGADRIANLIAAKAQYGSPVMVVDFGTATNIDVADKTGAFVGGVISPGVILSADALFARAALLAGVPIEMPPSTIGNTTTTSIQSGVIIGAAAMIEGLVARIKQELDAPECPVIATGGLSRTVSQATSVFDAIEPYLTLQGIYLLWTMQKEEPPF